MGNKLAKLLGVNGRCVCLASTISEELHLSKLSAREMHRTFKLAQSISEDSH